MFVACCTLRSARESLVYVVGIQLKLAGAGRTFLTIVCCGAGSAPGQTFFAEVVLEEVPKLAGEAGGELVARVAIVYGSTAQSTNPYRIRWIRSIFCVDSVGGAGALC